MKSEKFTHCENYLETSIYSAHLDIAEVSAKDSFDCTPKFYYKIRQIPPKLLMTITDCVKFY